MINLNLSAFVTNAVETLCPSNTVTKFRVKDVLTVIGDRFYSIDRPSERHRSIEDFNDDVIHLRIEPLLLGQSKDEGLAAAIRSLAGVFMLRTEVVEPVTRKGKKTEPPP